MSSIRKPWRSVISGALGLCLLFARPAHSQVQALDATEFFTGADISFLPFYEKTGVRYYEASQERDFLTIARRNGWNILRVRLWVDPEAKPEFQVSRLEDVTLLGRRIKVAGFQFLLDIHYSDSWADPGKQKKPAAWADLPFPQLVERVQIYTRDVVKHLANHGARPDIVQVGNEIKNGLLFGSGLHGSGPQPGGGFEESDKGGALRAVQLFAAGVQGVHDAEPGSPPLTMLHIPDGQDTGFIKWYFSHLQSTARAATPPVKFDFDLVGLSYYPSEPWDVKAGYEPWHLSNLNASMKYLAAHLRKPIFIVETNWPYRGTPQRMPGKPEFSFTPEGQMHFLRALIKAVREIPNGLGRGVLLWEPDTLNWHSVFDDKGHALPAVSAFNPN